MILKICKCHSSIYYNLTTAWLREMQKVNFRWYSMRGREFLYQTEHSDHIYKRSCCEVVNRQLGRLKIPIEIHVCFSYIYSFKLSYFYYLEVSPLFLGKTPLFFLSDDILKQPSCEVVHSQ